MTIFQSLSLDLSVEIPKNVSYLKILWDNELQSSDINESDTLLKNLQICSKHTKWNYKMTVAHWWPSRTL